MKQKINVGILLSVLLIASVVFASPIQLVLNGQTLQTELAPIQEKGVTLVPLRVVSEGLGATVTYEAQEQQIQIAKNNQVITLMIGQPAAISGGQQVSLEVAPRIVKGTTFVPLRFVSENLGCSVQWEAKSQTIYLASDENPESLPVATLKIQGLGEIKAELYPSLAPNTVNNFISLANKGFYDGLTFHRVIDNFMIQGGCPKGDGTGGPGYSISGEFTSNDFKTNTLKHTEGVLSMARSSHPDSAGSQFFIMTSVSPHLDGEYAAFGKVIAGMDIVYQIGKTQTNWMDRPVSPIVIESIRVDTNGINDKEPIKIQN